MLLEKTTTQLDVAIRAVYESDIDVLRAVAKLTQPRLASVAPSEWWRAISRGEIAAHVATVEGDKVVAVVITCKQPVTHTIEVVLLFVGERYRKRGIGTKLLKHVVRAGSGASVSIARSNDVALEFFRKAGFVARDDVLLVR